MMWYMDDTLDEEDFFMIFGFLMSWKYNTLLTFVNLILVKITFTQSFLLVLHVQATHADFDQANKLVLVFALILDS